MTDKTEGESAFSLMGQGEWGRSRMEEKMESASTRITMERRRNRYGKKV